MIPQDQPLQIGSLLFEGLDQIDLLLTPDAVLTAAPQLDVLHVPGGPGQEALMNDDEVLDWCEPRRQGRGSSSPCARER